MNRLKPRWEPPKTSCDSVGRFQEDLGRVEDICEAPAARSEKRFICSGGLKDKIERAFKKHV